MKKTREQLENVENLVKLTYNRRGRKLREVLDKKYSAGEPLGYSWRYDDPNDGSIIYNIVAVDLGDKYEYTSYRIKMHEYGHVYFGHFDGVYEDLDKNIANVLHNFRGQIVDEINQNCGIDFGEDLVEKVLDDPNLNHSIHNIAMDMEVNSKLLSNEDVVEMEKDISDFMPKIEEQQLEDLKKNQDLDEETKKQIDDQLDKMKKESKVKLILPCRYHTADGIPFPDELSYPEYIILIIKNFSQFIKSTVGISLGGNGDTKNVSKEDVQKALKNGAKSLDDLMKQMGMSDDSDEQGQGQNGEGQGGGQGQGQPGGEGKELGSHDTSNSGGFRQSNEERISENQGIRNKDYGKLKKDHYSPSRQKADVARSLGKIKAGGGFGCGSGGGPDAVRLVSKTDEVDMAMDEVIAKTKSRVIKRKIKRDIIRNYNLGKNRTVIAPSIIAKNRIDTKPKIVFIIDISGSMDTELVDRILNTISREMKKINRGLTYDIITWSTYLGEHIKDIEPGKPIPKIHVGGGTSMASALKYFKDSYDTSATFILISDFEDYLGEWISVLKNMPGYSGWGFNYGTRNYKMNWPKNFTVRNFNKSYTSQW